MNKRIALLQNDGVSDTYGGAKACWQSYATVWAAVQWRGTISEKESDIIADSASCIFFIRKRSDISTGDRVSLSDGLFEITVIDNFYTDKKLMRLFCTEVRE